MMSSRGIIGCSAAAVLLVALSSAVEVYDDLAPANLETDMSYQEDSDLDTGPVDEMNIPSLKSMMLFKMIKALQAHHAQSRISNGPNWQLTDGLPVTNLKDSVFKRLSQVISSKDHVPPLVTRPQPKWKTKKGKAIGSHLVCYFKLCAFRSPA